MNSNPRIEDEVHISEEEMEKSLKSTKPKKPLWCICYEEKVRGVLKGHKVYVHADTEGEARLQYFYSEPPKKLRQRNIVGVARVIGFFVDDNHGESLSVD